MEVLQAEIRPRTGRSVTRQELLSWLIDDAYDSRDEVIDSFRSSTLPLGEEDKDRMRRGRVSSGVETDEDDTDDVLSGRRSSSTPAFCTRITTPTRRDTATRATRSKRSTTASSVPRT